MCVQAEHVVGVWKSDSDSLMHNIVNLTDRCKIVSRLFIDLVT